jgi:UDP-N-acetylmuramate: L-alanyl-gamma-D-glutamyl-meso-diaminopimelate ligase
MRIYFLGIGGTAMGNAALLLRSAGHEVLGADENVYPPMSDVLKEAEIPYFEGYDADRIDNLQPDLVVVGNALSRGNPEIERLLVKRDVPFESLPAVLSRFVLAKRRNIVISGTHGKTTTTSLTAFLLQKNGANPGFLIGGVPNDQATGTHLGDESAAFVIEGDEYDSAFFDKRSKFIHYAPHIAVLNNLEFDHADIFRDLADIKRTFSHFLRIIPGNGFVLLNGDDENLRSLLPVPWTTVLTVGTSEESDLRIDKFTESQEGTSFELYWKGKLWTTVMWSLSGLYNVRNVAMAALAAGLDLYPDDPTQLSLETLSEFQGVRRRQDICWEKGDVVVIEDFGHHPTAIEQTLEALRARYPGRTLLAAFEPRSNTARTNVLQERFTKALSEADEVFIGPVSRADRMKEDERLDTVGMVKQIKTVGKTAHAFDANEVLLKELEASVSGRSELVVIFFSNGSFDGVIEKFSDRAEECFS